MLEVPSLTYLPAGQPPHKVAGPDASPEMRLAMLQLSLAAHPRMNVDDRELRRSGLSYTYLTLQELHSEHPEEPIYFLLGADNVGLLKNWVQAEEVLRLCHPVVVPRRGFRSHFRAEELPFVSAERLAQINSMALPEAFYPCSSSEIRARVVAGKDISHLVPSAVASYIQKHGLYR